MPLSVVQCKIDSIVWEGFFFCLLCFSKWFYVFFNFIFVLFLREEEREHEVG